MERHKFFIKWIVAVAKEKPEILNDKEGADVLYAKLSDEFFIDYLNFCNAVTKLDKKAKLTILK